MVGEDLVESGQADALWDTGSWAESARPRVERSSGLRGKNIIYQQLSYLMRSGFARFTGSHGVLELCEYGHVAGHENAGSAGWQRCGKAGIQTFSLSCIREGLKRVDVDELYDCDQYRPKVRQVDGKADVFFTKPEYMV